MDGALKKKGISLSMQYLNETPLGQIASSRGLLFYQKYSGLYLTYTIYGHGIYGHTPYP